MKIRLTINYTIDWGQVICVCGSAPELGHWDENNALEMKCASASLWSLDFEIAQTSELEYYYLIKEGTNIIRREWRQVNALRLDKNKIFRVHDIWRDIPKQQFLYTSGFSESFFTHEKGLDVEFYNKTLLLKVDCPYVKKDQELILCGASNILGDWDADKALRLIYAGNNIWQISLDASSLNVDTEYKFAIYDKRQKQLVNWEEGYNRILPKQVLKDNVVKIESFSYNYAWMNWRTSGVAIPVFSLRSETSFGIGEFSDLIKLIDWAVVTKQRIIQILPINDTTVTHKWTDSYPYNAISIYALNPIYLGLADYPLKEKTLLDNYKAEAEELNSLTVIDYEKTLALKENYLKELYAECGANILKKKECQIFFDQNKEWLFPYACFSYLRDKHHTADMSQWGEFSIYNIKKLEEFVVSDQEAEKVIKLVYFTQYLLHEQLSKVKKYAHVQGVILKGDIPIGISRNSVEAWTEPHLFNLDTQTGAPPDDFSVDGQNWGFPTYNWDEMAKDGYQWWVKRFRKMSDYFDAYRIDHILGFFRIWEIPLHSVQGLLGYFSPALPFSIEEINNGGLSFDESRMIKAYIHEGYLEELFGDCTNEVIDTYMYPIGNCCFNLNEDCDTQIKIKQLFEGKEDEKSNRLRSGLYSLCNEVLFIYDKRQPHLLHPRISAQHSYTYKYLDDNEKQAFDNLYEYFFYQRHSDFWRNEAIKKLPPLIASTQMLVCGEDLGMIPDCVPSVMHELQILSLEIERMPKEYKRQFANLQYLPYESVCTTSTHDMSPIRAWWQEDRFTVQKYYNEVLWKFGEAPEVCLPDICWQILLNHLNSPSMLAIFPLQDWLSINDKYKRENAEEERINIPAVAQHYWCYRMHLTLEELIVAKDLNEQISALLTISNRI